MVKKELYKKSNFFKVTEISELELAKFMHQLQNNKLPKLFQHLFRKIDTGHGHKTRHASKNFSFRPRVKKMYYSILLAYIRGLKLCTYIDVVYKKQRI